jgi:dTDP-4-amino-4,6-dideoxygalactose transaminase
VFHAFEGGLLVTDNGDLARNARLMLNHGFEGSDRVVSLGLNAKMTEVCAAMGLTNLRGVDRFIEENRRNYRTYDGEFEAVPGVILARVVESERCNYHYVIAEIDEESFGLSRDALYAILHAENVIARRYFHPGIHRMEPYRTLDPDAGRRLPHTEALCRRTLAFPTGTQMTPETIAAIGNLVAFCHAQAREIRQRLGPPLS